MKHILSCWLFFCTLSLSTTGNAVTNVLNVQLGEAKGHSTFVLSLDGPVNINSFPLDSPNRVVLDLTGASLFNPHQLSTLKSPLLRGVRYSSEANRLRIVLDVTRPLVPRSYFTGDDRKHRLVIELRDSPALPKTPPAIMAKAKPTPKPQPVAVARPVPAPKKEKESVSPVLARFVKEKDKVPAVAAVTVRPAPTSATEQLAGLSPIFNQLPSKKGRNVVIAIDAGHGGKDPGAIGPRGVEEKTVTLAIAQRLAELIRRERGMTPVLTRTGDYFVPLRERIHKAHNAQADLFISIHADAAHDSSATGASVYILSRKGASSEAARLLAEKENAVDLVGGINLKVADNNLARTLLDMSQNATLDASLAIASRVLASIERVGAISRSTVERAGFLVLKSPDIPSVLVEAAYLSNPEEELKLTSSYYQQAVAQAIMKGIRAYFIGSPPSGTLLAQSILAQSPNIDYLEFLQQDDH